MEKELILQALQKNSDPQKGSEVSNKPKITASQMANALKERAIEREINLVIDEQNERAITLLCQYFSRDSDFELNGMSLKKGLLLHGGTGCGKTTLMRLCMDNLVHMFGTVNCRKVASDFAIEGDEGIEKYFRMFKRSENLLYGFCFDDFGSEPIKLHFGSKIEVMEEVLLRRYDFGKPFYTTHITTNKTSQEIRERYGDRVADRCKEMFNIIEFPANAKSRRI